MKLGALITVQSVAQSVIWLCVFQFLPIVAWDTAVQRSPLGVTGDSRWGVSLLGVTWFRWSVAPVRVGIVECRSKLFPVSAHTFNVYPKTILTLNNVIAQAMQVMPWAVENVPRWPDPLGVWPIAATPAGWRRSQHPPRCAPRAP